MFDLFSLFGIINYRKLVMNFLCFSANYNYYTVDIFILCKKKLYYWHGFL